ncbi:MAG: DUF3108 domain-containing protein [Undibacterium sp.]|uniref:DUF3108 domain-containing protein n=1 Tax=Undibacterium sp. TaxID=1914977 RepID=UPI00271CC900|nr:DUF3108 domain-containing protein [Undibacterium sp.]MDO8653134.1 DUF3108 domain-containing protein [Undibacterium sp.]
MRHPIFCFKQLCLVASISLGAVAHADNSINLAPSAELNFNIKAKQKGIPVSGEAIVKWQLNDKQNYSVITETRVMLFGKILDASSYGSIDEHGLAPEKFVEKRFGKTESVTRFDRSSKTIQFTDSSETYPIKGGEQDRTSATWQLVTLARAANDKFKAGSEWKMFVAGRRDAEPWSFKVSGTETLSTPLGELATIHITKAPPPDSKGQQLEIWLAPKLEWYPVRLKFSDADGDTVDQVISSIKK